MANTKNAKGNSGSNDGLALIIGGLFVLALVFATYSYFNKSEPLEESVEGEMTERRADSSSDEKSLGERIKELFSSEPTEDGDLNGEGATTKDMEDKGSDTDSYSVFGQWVANDYEEGDISGTSYVVKSGDTLWEIAEAKYGSGFDWTKILEANSSDIGYLPNGQQALIVTGQTLVLP